MLCDVCEGYAWIAPVGAAPPQIVYHSANDPVKALEEDKALFETFTGEVLHVDPYMGPASLDRLAFFRNADRVRFLTSKVQDPDGNLAAKLADFKRWIPNVEMRRLSGRELHSRYIIVGNRLVQLGHSGQGGGTQESVVTDTGDAGHLQEQIDTLRSEFEEKWARADPL